MKQDHEAEHFRHGSCRYNYLVQLILKTNVLWTYLMVGGTRKLIARGFCGTVSACVWQQFHTTNYRLTLKSNRQTVDTSLNIRVTLYTSLLAISPF